ncbi:MAG TPA: aconitate hydratase [Rectinemataceae bacterium]|nr:aconitate hydratase [Rectinemataceae bacterium]
MGMSLTRKVLEPHLVEGEWKPGGEIGIRVDQTLTQDATGTMAYLQFEALGVPRVKTELSVSYIDHNTLQIGFENADDHRYLASVARKYGICLSRAGNGICHQVHLERFGRPGRTLLGSDSHTPTCGGLGMIAIGAGGLDVAMAMGGSPFYLSCPAVTAIRLSGRLRSWVSAKDVALAVLARFGTKGNVGRVFEYAGEGVKSLSVPERATIANMGAECGVTTTIFPSDGATLAFLRSQGRGADWAELGADEGAVYEEEFRLDLSSIEPLAALPHSPGNVRPLREAAGTRVEQVCVGSCTNSSYRDLALVAKLLEGKTVHPELSLVVTPGSRQVLRNIDRDGYLEMLIAAGARLVEPSCGFCIGNGQSPASGSVSLRTSNRNFEGRSGTADARVFLVSPEAAAAAALSGRIVDPRDAGLKYPEIAVPELLEIDDGMILRPEATSDPASVEIVRGPNIGEPLVNAPFPDKIAGVVAIKLGDKITTDHIMPAGSRMKYRSNIRAYAEYVFENVDREFPARAAELRDAGTHVVVAAGQSYGQGSSREHAAICPSYLGVRLVLAKSFERIHAANLANFGILPLSFLRDEDYEALASGDGIEIPDCRSQIRSGGPIRISVRSSGRDALRFIEAACELLPRQREILLAGGALPYARVAGKSL